MASRPDDLIYAVDEKPPLFKLILLGLQHTMLMSVYLVIIVIIAKKAGVNEVVIDHAIRMGLIALAISTLLQSIKKGPIGSGYLAVPVVSAIYIDPSLLAVQQGGLGFVFLMTMFAGVVEIIFSRILYHIRAFFPPGICGFIILVVGLQLGIIGVHQVLAIEVYNTPQFSMHITAALVTLFTMLALSVWWRGTMRLMCSFIGIVVGYIFSFFAGVLPASQLALIGKASFFGLPDPSYITYHFSPSLIMPFLIAGIAASLRTVGVITTCQKINDNNWKHPDLKSIKGGLFADGIGCFIAGLLGCPGMSTAPSLVGVSQATGATSRYIAYSASAILVTLAFIPKITSLFLIMPLPVIGAALVFSGSFMIIGGIQIMMSRNIDTRMTFVIGISFLMGISRDLFPHYYQSLPHIVQMFTGSMLSLSVTMAIILNLFFRIGIKRKATIAIEIEETSVSYNQIQMFLQKRGKEWEVGNETINRAIATTKEILKHLHDTNLVATHDIKTTVSYDQVDFLVTIHYKGELLFMPFVGKKRTVFLEEEAFSYGLADFWTGVFPDKLEYSTKGSLVEIRLYFNAN